MFLGEKETKKNDTDTSERDKQVEESRPTGPHMGDMMIRGLCVLSGDRGRCQQCEDMA